MIVHFTGYELDLDNIELDDPRDVICGHLIGTADMIAQMADRCYLEKCRDRLYNEFVVGGVAIENAKPGEYMTDRLRISREKLAYLVDSTAAPVATIAIITTWIGFQLGLVDTAIEDIPAIEQSAYSLFLNSIPYSFYPILAIFFVFLVVYTGKDFGPMVFRALSAFYGLRRLY